MRATFLRPALLLPILLSPIGPLSAIGWAEESRQPDVVIGGFDTPSLAPWSVTGDAFRRLPSHPPGGARYENGQGSGLVASDQSGPTTTGTLVSPRFTTERKFINFLVAGERNLPGTLGVELVADGRVVRSSSATEAGDRVLYQRTWDVADLADREVQIRVNDRSASGSIAVDQFVQSDDPGAAAIDASRLFDETFRPQFHYTPRAYWMNDPNGLFYYRGRWHLFHQHRYPGGSGTVWAHAVSTDLVGWTRLDVAVPTDTEDSNFSGSGLVDWANASGLKTGPDAALLVFYTLRPPGPVEAAADDSAPCTQCMAYSTDGGDHWQKFAGNPVLRTPDRRDRDPKVFYYEPGRVWIMVLSLSANNADRKAARYGIFRSADLRSWELIQSLGPDGWFWECPDMFELPVDGDPHRRKWLVVKGSGDYIVGTFDGNAFRPESDRTKSRWGGNYYATQTFNDAPGGRRVQIGWMNTGKAKRPNSYPGMPFNQQMSFPRELTLRTTPDGPRLFRYPVAEIEKLWGRTHEWKEQTLKPGENALADVHYELLDIDLEIRMRDARQLRIDLRGEKTVYDAADGKLRAFGAAAPLPAVDGRVRLRLLLDRTSVEVFGNDGQCDLSGVFYPNPSNRRMSLTVEGDAAEIVRLSVRELRRARSL